MSIVQSEEEVRQALLEAEAKKAEPAEAKTVKTEEVKKSPTRRRKSRKDSHDTYVTS
jgi:hypothetical protein